MNHTVILNCSLQLFTQQHQITRLHALTNLQNQSVPGRLVPAYVSHVKGKVEEKKENFHNDMLLAS